MTWLEHHRRSTKLAATARKLRHVGDEGKAQRLYGEAAAEAERAMALVPAERRVTVRAIAVLAHGLWRRARRSDDAARVAAAFRGSPELFAVTVSPPGSSASPLQPTKRK